MTRFGRMRRWDGPKETGTIIMDLGLVRDHVTSRGWIGIVIDAPGTYYRQGATRIQWAVVDGLSMIALDDHEIMGTEDY